MTEARDMDVSATAASLQSIPAGKLVDFIMGKLVNDTPEEYVRQNIEMSLVLEYGYDRSQIEVEYLVKVGSSKRWVDLAIFPKDAPHFQHTIETIVETKKQATSPSDRREGVGQLQAYMASSLNCQYGMWTNGDERLCFRKTIERDQFAFMPAIDIPVQGARGEEGPTRRILRAATGDNLLFAFRRCHNYIAGNQGLQKPEAFWELLKLIFCKIEDERSGDATMQFYASDTERHTMNGQTRVKARLQRLFREHVVTKYPTIFPANDDLNMLPAVVAYCVSELQQYSLLNSPVDVKGVAYEEVVGSNLRGDRGEFFTPRNACRMAMSMISPRPHERIIDPACGTGGFLITAMNHVLGRIEGDEKRRWIDTDNPSRYELDEYYRRRTEYLTQHVFGLDLNPNLVRAAKMNMVMNNDGSGSLFQCNSLEHPHRWPEAVQPRVQLGTFDVVFTNPPFGAGITIDDPRILKQYELAAQWIDLGSEGCALRRDGRGEPVLQQSQPPEILFLERCIQLLKPGTGRMAMVVPNGILNNPGLKYVRQYIANETQVLAVVDMHRNLFQPKNDTQTSMLLLRRRAPGEVAHDYPIFMAVADTVGHDRRGKTINKRNPDGTEVLERRVKESIRIVGGQVERERVEVLEPVVDDDLDDVPEAYLAWLAERAPRQPGIRAG
jgi:type I restriction enzyme M protein